MAKYFEYELEDGATVLIETEEEKGIREVSRGSKYGDVFIRAQNKYKEAFSHIKAAVIELSAQLRDMEADEAEVTFGLKIAAESGNFVIAKGSIDANYTVKLKWNRSKEK